MKSKNSRKYNKKKYGGLAGVELNQFLLGLPKPSEIDPAIAMLPKVPRNWIGRSADYLKLFTPMQYDPDEITKLCSDEGYLNVFKQSVKNHFKKIKTTKRVGNQTITEFEWVGPKDTSPGTIDMLINHACNGSRTARMSPQRKWRSTSQRPNKANATFPKSNSNKLTNLLGKTRAQAAAQRACPMEKYRLVRQQLQNVHAATKHSNNTASKFGTMMESIDMAIKHGERREYGDAAQLIDESIEMLKTLSRRVHFASKDQKKALHWYVHWLKDKISEDIRRTAAAAAAAPAPAAAPAASGVTQGQGLELPDDNGISFSDMGNNNTIANIARTLPPAPLPGPGGSRKKSRKKSRNRSKRKKSRKKSNRKKSRKKSRRR